MMAVKKLSNSYYCARGLLLAVPCITKYAIEEVNLFPIYCTSSYVKVTATYLGRNMWPSSGNACYKTVVIQCVPIATEPGISLIILTPMKTLQRNLNRSTFVVWEMKRNVSVVRFKFRCKILISGKIIKEIPVSVASGTHCI